MTHTRHTSLSITHTHTHMHVFTHTCVPHEVVDAQADGRDDHGVELAGREGEVVDLADDAGAQEAVLFLLLPPPLQTQRERDG